MAISVADNFSYQGTKPLDARVKFDTKTSMKNFEESKLYDGCLAYVTDEKAYYTYDSSNNVDVYTGRWRQFVPVGGSLSNEISGHDVYSTTEKLIGQWIDGKPLYQKVLSGSFPEVQNSVSYPTKLNQWQENYIDVSSLNIDSMASIKCVYSSSSQSAAIDCVFVDGYGGIAKCIYWKEGEVVILRSCTSTFNNAPAKIIIQYTKTTDSAQSIGSINEYSTTEKIVGTWIDGKPLYQRVFSFPGAYQIPPNTRVTVLSVDVPIKTMITSKVVTGDTNYPGEETLLSAKYFVNDKAFKLVHTRNQSIDIHEPSYIICQYTKTTD